MNGMNGKASPMQDYMAQYGQRLQSLLSGAMTPQDARMAPARPMRTANPPLQSGLVQANPIEPQVAKPGASSFRTRWEESSEEEQKDFTDDLEKQLKSGNQSIDSAYDDLIKQLGERPSPDHKLTREEKGMMLMEFGLSLMANSSAKAYGQDLGGAIGASGLQTMVGHRERRQRATERYDEQRMDIEKGRAGAKSRLAEQSALEARSEARDERRREREESQLAGVVTGADDMLYGYTRGGGVSQLAQPGGGGVKVKPKPVSTGGGSARTLEQDRRYQLYLDIYGKDASGNPLAGPELEAVRKRALAFSVDPKAATLSEGELRKMAETSADNFMRSNWSLFRDMTPDQTKAWRDKNAEESYQRLKNGQDIALAPPEPKQPTATTTPGKPKSALAAGQKPSFKSTAEIAAALRANEIKMGDTVILNGKPFVVRPKQQGK